MLTSDRYLKRWTAPLLALLCALSISVVSIRPSSSAASVVQCSFCVTPATKTFDSAANVGTLTVVAAGGCSWTATSNSSFITITQGSNGTGNGSVGYSIDANPNNAPRTGTLTVAGQTVAVTQYAGCTVRPTGLVAWWPGDDNVTDIVGGNQANLHGGAFFAAGEVDRAFNFDGVDDYISTNLDVQPSVMASTTWEAWVYPTRLDHPARQTILSDDDGGFDRSITIEPFSSNFGVFTGSGVWQPAGATLNEWQHIAVVYSPTNIEFYRNGVRFSLDSPPTGQGSTGRLQFGASSAFSDFYKGRIDEVSIYNRALGAPEIGVIYNAGVGGKCRWRDFADVPPTHLFYNEIRNISSQAITLGCGGNNFCPNDSVTREQMAAFIVRALGIHNPPQPTQQRFADVPPSNTFYAFIEQMAVLGITQGCGGGNFCPQQPVTRDQMAAFIIRALGVINPPQPAQQRFADVPPSNIFYASIEQLALQRITLGCSVNPPNYCPSDPVTRGQMAAFLSRGFGQVANQFPAVFAGLDQTLSLPGTASLSGMVNDDGLPACGMLTVMWSQVSGPGTVNFTNPTAEMTAASFSQAGSYVLRLTASDSQLSNYDEVTIAVNPADPNNQPPSVSPGPNQTITLPNTASLNGNVTDDGNPAGGGLSISWSKVSGPGVVIFSNASGATTTAMFTVDGTYVLRLSASDSQLNSSADLTITVNADPTPPPPDPVMEAPPVDPSVVTTIGAATQFLYTGSSPIQTGVAPGTIKMERAAVLRGRVLDKAGAPISRVKIGILNHPEFGQTFSRADGKFDLAVNGGGILTLTYEKSGCLPVERRMDVPWQDYVMADDVVMLCYDPQVTHIDLSSNIPIQVAQGTSVTDTDGQRRGTLLFKLGTTATMKLADGSMQGLTHLHVRATEYTTGANGPATMPGDLPATSSYTYAAEYSVDEAVGAGAKSVTFSQPVIQYLNNFLDFPVGIVVPVGSYDRDGGIWMPEPNGLVVKILSISNGQANIDVHGDGQPAIDAEYAALGINIAERQRLSSLYSAGESLWRVPRSHFSPCDYNWPAYPPDATANKGKAKCDCAGPCPPEEEGSIIECESQTVGERVRIVGTTFGLTYVSDRVPGRKAANTITIPLSAASVPASLKRIELDVSVAGQMFHQTFSNAPNQTTTFTWDGRDAYNRLLQGKQVAAVRVGYVYDVVYSAVSNFGGFGDGGVMLSAGRNEVTLVQNQRVVIGVWDARGIGLGGWDLSEHHAYDPIGQVLYLGNGRQRVVRSVDNVITTFAGGGSPPDGLGDGGLATQAQLSITQGSIVVSPDGTIFFADDQHHRIRKVALNGIISTVAGTGTAGYNGDGIAATLAQLHTPLGLALGPDGSLYISDTLNYRIRKVSPNGIITTVAGDGTQGYSGDGGPATQSQLDRPHGIALAPDGNLYVADQGNVAVRRIAPDGIITTVVAGSGGGGARPIKVGKPSSPATLQVPWMVAIGPDGLLYVSDADRVVRINPDMSETVIAGGAFPPDGYGDGGPATDANVGGCSGIAFGPDGSLYIVQGGLRVRVVSPDGIITRAAGNNTTGAPLGDGSPALNGQLTSAFGVAVGPDASFYITDLSRIRKISHTLPGFSASSIAIPSADGSELYEFDSTGRHLRTVNSLTGANTYVFSYDSAGRLSQVTDGDGNITTVERDVNGNPADLVAPFGEQTNLTVNANGYLSTITDPASQAHQLAYTTDGLMTTFTNPRGQATTFLYDAMGRLTKDTDAATGFKSPARTELADGHTTTITTALGRTTSYQVRDLAVGDQSRVNTDRAGFQTQINRGANGAIKTTSPDGTVDTVSQSGDPRWRMQAPLPATVTVKTPAALTSISTFARMVTLSDPNNLLSLTAQNDTFTINGRTYTNNYAAATRTFTISSPLGRQATSTIDTQGRVTQSQFANLHAANFSYDTHGRLSTAVFGAGAQARNFSLSYNADGYLSSIMDPLTRTASFLYDAAGRVTQKTLLDGRVISFAYDANGNLTSLTPPGRPAHSFAYSSVDLRSTYTPPNVGGTNQTTFAYNLDRQLMTITRPDSQTLSFAYDSGARLSTLTIPGGAFTFAYDGTTGNLSSITAPGGGTVTYAYDGSLPILTTWAGTVTGNVSHVFDNNFRITSQRVNGANMVGLTYDNDSLLTGVGSLTLTHNAQSGLITGTTLGSVTDSLGYTGFGEVSGYSAVYNSTGLYSASYTYDKLSRITQKVETIGGITDTYDYTYDTAGRLTQVKKNNAVTGTYTYDTNSNRLSYTGAGPAINGSYDDQDRLTQYGSALYAYSANGELVSKTVGAQMTTYQYDVVGNLKNAGLPDGTQIDYLIDGQHRRIGKKVNGTLVQGLLYQNALSPVAELDGSNNIVSRFVYASRVNVPDYMIRGGATYRILSDQLGSPRLVVNISTGVIAQRIDYDEFGVVVADTNPGFQPFGFAGGLYDKDTGLVRFGARDYDAQTGRWTAKDPILFAGRDTNLYGYVLNDPINSVDPNGRLGFLFPGTSDPFLGDLNPDQFSGKFFPLETLDEYYKKLLDEREEKEINDIENSNCPPETKKKKIEEIRKRYSRIQAIREKFIREKFDELIRKSGNDPDKSRPLTPDELTGNKKIVRF